MEKIYKQGARSMIWLGEDDGGRHGCVLQLLNELSATSLLYDDELMLHRKFWREWIHLVFKTGDATDDAWAIITLQTSRADSEFFLTTKLSGAAFRLCKNCVRFAPLSILW